MIKQDTCAEGACSFVRKQLLLEKASFSANIEVDYHNVVSSLCSRAAGCC